MKKKTFRLLVYSYGVLDLAALITDEAIPKTGERLTVDFDDAEKFHFLSGEWGRASVETGRCTFTIHEVLPQEASGNPPYPTAVCQLELDEEFGPNAA